MISFIETNNPGILKTLREKKAFDDNLRAETMKALEACAAAEGGKQTIANAVAISSGGEPIFLVAEEEVFVL